MKITEVNSTHKLILEVVQGLKRKQIDVTAVRGIPEGLLINYRHDSGILAGSEDVTYNAYIVDPETHMLNGWGIYRYQWL